MSASPFSITIPVQHVSALVSQEPSNAFNSAQRASLQAMNNYLEGKIQRQQGEICSLETLRKSHAGLYDLNERLSNDVIAEQIRHTELSQRFDDSKQEKETLVMVIRDLRAALEVVTSSKDPINATNSDSDLTLSTSLTSKPSTFATSFGNDIDQFLAKQRLLGALYRAQVELESTTMDRGNLKSALETAEARVERLTAELGEANSVLAEAQKGVIHYHDKSDKQRRQLGDVQAANANLKRENGRLRTELRELRRSERRDPGHHEGYQHHGYSNARNDGQQYQANGSIHGQSHGHAPGLRRGFPENVIDCSKLANPDGANEWRAYQHNPGVPGISNSQTAGGSVSGPAEPRQLRKEMERIYTLAARFRQHNSMLSAEAAGFEPAKKEHGAKTTSVGGSSTDTRGAIPGGITSAEGSDRSACSSGALII